MSMKNAANEPVWAVASGKGGTGKTTVAVNLACVLGPEVRLIDCDVEEPDARLFLPGELTETVGVNTRVPEIDQEACDYCGVCARFCQFNALAVAGSVAMVFPELCHGCRGCSMVCPQRAIRMVSHRVGEVNTIRTAAGWTLVEGVLDVGHPSAVPVIEAVRRHRIPEVLTLLDAPPGTSCSAVATLRDVDAVVLVTEPTPFGLNDLRLIVELVRRMNLPFGVVVNRTRPGNRLIENYCKEEGIPVWMEIEEDRRYAEVMARGRILTEAFPELRDRFVRCAEKLREVTR